MNAQRSVDSRSRLADYPRALPTEVAAVQAVPTNGIAWLAQGYQIIPGRAA